MGISDLTYDLIECPICLGFGSSWLQEEDDDGEWWEWFEECTNCGGIGLLEVTNYGKDEEENNG